ncbi:uncharacterized protein DEA37_0013919 [Paragonimus westermani]|uniref:Forkhead-associated domain-containing protein 1 n=1 Tax=Paragonimus westermani TaxID=34504 RepID=A0A5J4NL23_9TREM|nr:uncharacterized protein DEA37_0013919 [Paragonimus westermani]
MFFPKDQLISRLQNDLNRLSPLEAISAQKDILIRRLQQQVTQLSIGKIPRSVPLTHESPSSQTRQEYERLEIPVGPGSHDIVNPTDTADSSPTCAIRSNTRPVSASSTGPPYHISSQTAPNPLTGSLAIDQHLVERLKKERQILSGLVTQLQRDLTNKDAYVGRLNQDLKEMGRKLDEKSTALSILQAKFVKAHDNSKYLQQTEAHEKEMTAIRQKYKATEIRCDTLNNELDRTKLELEKLKQVVDEKQSCEEKWHKEMEDLKSTVISLERAERNAKLDKQETVSQYERLRSRIMRAVFAVHPDRILKMSSKTTASQGEFPQNEVDFVVSSDGFKRAISDTSNNAAVDDVDDQYILDRVQDLTEQLIKFRRQKAEEEGEKLQQNAHNNDVEGEVIRFIDELLENQQSVTDLTGLRSSSRLRSHLEMLNTFSPTSKCVKRLQEFLMEDLQHQISASQRLEDCIQEVATGLSSVCVDYPISLAQRPDDLVCTIRRLAQIGMTVQADRERIKNLLKEAEIQSGKELERVRQLFRGEIERKIEEALIKNNEEHAEKLRQTVNQVAQIENDRHEQMVTVKQAIIEELENKLRETRQMMAERQATYDAQMQEVLEKANGTEEVKLREEMKDKQLAELHEQVNELKGVILRTKEDTELACEKRWANEVDSHREQAKQHARTICVMEERLIKLVKQTKEAKAEVQRLTRQNCELQSEHKLLEGRLTEAQRRLTVTKKTTTAGSDDRSEKYNNQPHRSSDDCRNEILRNEVAGLRTLLTERNMTIDTLRADLKGTRAQLSDLRGELTEAQKEEIESALEFGKRTSSELASDGGAGEAYDHNRQLANLRRELAELRSQNLISEVFPSLSPSRTPALDFGSSVSDEGHRAGDVTNIEKSGLRNAMDALQASEESYLDLVRSIALHLELGTLPGQRSLVLVPSIEREAVRRERRQTVELLTQRVAVLREQVERKDHLLSNYDRDMGKLRQAEALTEAKSEQLDNMIAKLRSKENEIQLLRQALDRTHQELTNEKRTVSAIKKTKVSLCSFFEEKSLQIEVLVNTD